MIKLTMNEQKVNNVMVELIAGKIRVKDAMRLLGWSKRHTLRKKRHYIESGIACIPHKSRGKPTGRGYCQEFKNHIIQLYKSEYSDWNFHHFNNQLRDFYDISVSNSFIYNLLTVEGIVSPQKRRKSKKSYPPRPRKEAAGALVQCDASQFQWFHGDKAYYYLHGAIDDATGIVTGAFIQKQETIYGYQMVLAQTISNYGIPEYLYTDYRTIFQSTKKELTIDEELKGKEIESTKFTKMLNKLGTGIISTTNPRAKGRIERLWRTFQVRLYNELKMLHITTIKEANDYLTHIFLPKYNSRFASQIDSNKNLFVCVDSNFDYNRDLAVWEKRRIYHNCYFSIKESYFIVYDELHPAYINTKKSILVYTFLDGSLNVFYNDKFYKTQVLDSKPNIKPLFLSEKSSKKVNSSKAHSVSPNHPWKNSKLTKNWDLYKNRSSIPR